jgi:hypothetical protein
MLTITLWLLAILLEALLLVRGFQKKLLGHFPIFYTYILFVFLEEFLRFCSYRWYPDQYFYVYWATQFFSLLIGSAVIFEIYRVGLRAFPGTARVMHYLLLLMFGGVLVRTMAHPSGGLFWWITQRSEELERDLRMVQALGALTLVSLFLWYAIPFGKNLRGILTGYGLFIAMSIVQLTLLPYFWGDIKLIWAYAQPASYLLVLLIWANALWLPHLVPEAKVETRLEKDYEVLVATTGNQFRRTLARLGWAARL